MRPSRKIAAARSAACFFFLFSTSLLFSQISQSPPPTVSLAAEIFRLETLSQEAASPATERHRAYLQLARLHRLSGDSAAALRAYEGAQAVVPNNGRALLEFGRFLISIGEYQRAAAAINALLVQEREGELAIAGRYVGAQLNAFHSGDTRQLAALAENRDFIQYHSGLLYTLWRLTGRGEYKSRLDAEFPHSAEAKIASGRVNPAVTPLWLLFPGRDSIVLAPAPTLVAPATPSAPAPTAPTPAVPTAPAPSAPTPTAPVSATPAPAVPAPTTPAPSGAPTPTASTPVAPATSVPTPVPPEGRLLQAGLFTAEPNARALAERISRAGFQPYIIKRDINGREHWAVVVHGGSDINAMIQRLSDSNFQTFPLPE